MAGGTSQALMLSGERESCQIMVNLSSFPPTCGRVTLAAILTQVTLMDILLGMAGDAILGGLLHADHGCFGSMTFVTRQYLVFSNQRKSDPGVIEGMSIGFNSIVAIDANSTVCRDMSSHKRLIQVIMASCANGLVERLIPVNMAIGAFERSARSHFLVQIK